MTLNLRNLSENQNTMIQARTQTSFTCKDHTFHSTTYNHYRQGFTDGLQLRSPVSDSVCYRQGFLDAIVLQSKAS